MGFQLNMDYSGIDPNAGGRSYLPVSDSKGWLVVMTDSQGKENGKKTGTILECKLVGQEGVVMGMEHTLTINITNPSQQAVTIGQGECSAIAHATGHVRVGNSQEWHGKPFRVVVVSDASEQYPNATRVQRIHDVNGQVPQRAGQGALQGGQQTAGNFGGNTGQASQGTGAAPVSGNGQFVQQGQPQGQFTQQQPTQGQQQFNPQQGQQFQPSQQQGQQFVQQGQGQPQGQFQQQASAGGFDPATGQPIGQQGQFQQGQGQGQPQFVQGQQGQAGGPGWSQ